MDALPPNVHVVYEVEEEKTFRPNRPLFIVGTFAFIGAFSNALYVRAMSDYDPDHWLLAPLAGPWLDLSHRTCDGACGPTETFRRVLLAFNGVSQATGFAVMVFGLILPERVKVKRPIIVPAATPTSATVSVFATF